MIFYLEKPFATFLHQSQLFSQHFATFSGHHNPKFYPFGLIKDRSVECEVYQHVSNRFATEIHIPKTHPSGSAGRGQKAPLMAFLITRRGIPGPQSENKYVKLTLVADMEEKMKRWKEDCIQI